MLLDDTKLIKNVVAARLAKVFYPFIIARTEEGQYLQVNLSQNEITDPTFWDTMEKICEEKIWLPVGRKFHQLLDNGWEVDPKIAS